MLLPPCIAFSDLRCKISYLQSTKGVTADHFYDPPPRLQYLRGSGCCSRCRNTRAWQCTRRTRHNNKWRRSRARLVYVSLSYRVGWGGSLAHNILKRP